MNIQNTAELYALIDEFYVMKVIFQFFKKMQQLKPRIMHKCHVFYLRNLEGIVYESGFLLT